MATDLTAADSSTFNDSLGQFGADSGVAVVDKPEHSAPKTTAVENEAYVATHADAGRDRWASGIDWPIAGWIAFLHAGALAAPFFFSWQGVVAVVVLGWISGGLGICLGYHRLFSHASFNTYRPVRWLIALFGVLAGEGPVIHWVAVHRKHHAMSDKEDDPHSPRDGFWWSHVQWIFPRLSREEVSELHERYAPDLLRDPVLRIFEKTFLLWHWALGFALFALGYFVWDARIAWSLVIYGIFLRLVLVLHSTWFVNSATHVWGYRNYETRDDSRNLWWVALLTFGEGWHNNHHAFPRMATAGHRWWEFDVTYRTIRLMEKLGLAWNVVRRRTGHSAPVA